MGGWDGQSWLGPEPAEGKGTRRDRTKKTKSASSWAVMSSLWRIIYSHEKGREMSRGEKVGGSNMSEKNTSSGAVWVTLFTVRSRRQPRFENL